MIVDFDSGAIDFNGRSVNFDHEAVGFEESHSTLVWASSFVYVL